MPKLALVVLAEGFEEIEAITQIDVLRRANIHVLVAALTDPEVKGAHNVIVQADTILSDVHETPDAIVLPGGMPGSANLGESKFLKELTAKVLASGGICAAICAAPAFTLAKWGLLDGKKATCYPSCEKDFPETATHLDDRVVVDGKIITSRAPGTALEFGLTLVELLTGKEMAQNLRAGMLVK